MDTQTIWLILLSIATPISGVVGFAIQLRQVRKARLENEKLSLEIAALKEKAASAENRIVRVTTEEVLRFANSDIRFSLATSDEVPRPSVSRWQAVRDIAAAVAVLFVLGLLVLYFIYDMYRLVVWMSSEF